MKPTFSRRDLLKLAGGTAVSAVAFSGPSFAGMLDGFVHRPAGLRSAITPNDEFYVTSYRSPAEHSGGNWQLVVKGLVERPMTVNYPALLARPSESHIVTLEWWETASRRMRSARPNGRA